MTENPAKRSRTDFTGVAIGLLVLPLYFVFVHFEKPAMGRAACICLAAFLLAIRINWDLRGKLWFWGLIVFLLTLHVPLVLLVPWPGRWIPAIGILPIALADCVIVLGAIWLVEKWMKRAQQPPNEVQAPGE
jgi:hypothetical protein